MPKRGQTWILPSPCPHNEPSSKHDPTFHQLQGKMMGKGVWKGEK